VETSNYVPNVRRAQATPLYDTLVIATTTPVGAEQTMFGRTAGANGIHITNMTRAFELPGIEAFTLRALRVIPIDCALADVVSLMKNYCLRLIRGKAVELEAPIEYWSAGAGLFGAATTTNATTTIQQWGNGVPDPRAVASLGDLPIRIEGGDHFEVKLVGVTFSTTAALCVRVYLDGIYEKGVQ